MAGIERTFSHAFARHWVRSSLINKGKEKFFCILIVACLSCYNLVDVCWPFVRLQFVHECDLE